VIHLHPQDKVESHKENIPLVVRGEVLVAQTEWRALVRYYVLVSLCFLVDSQLISN
jgi:hypothetical protein